MWGGCFYLLAKIVLSRAVEKGQNKKRAFGWSFYLLGIPAWVVLLATRHSWIALAVEAGGAPTMIVGIFANTKKVEQIPKIVNFLIKILVGLLIVLGVVYSVYDFGGITSISQILELGVTTGYLVGIYLLANKDRRGWLCFVLMNVSMGILTAMQGRWVVCILQAISLYFVISGFRKAKK
jgi:hypothetical protein